MRQRFRRLKLSTYLRVCPPSPTRGVFWGRWWTSSRDRLAGSAPSPRPEAGTWPGRRRGRRPEKSRCPVYWARRVPRLSSSPICKQCEKITGEIYNRVITRLQELIATLRTSLHVLRTNGYILREIWRHDGGLALSNIERIHRVNGRFLTYSRRSINWITRKYWAAYWRVSKNNIVLTHGAFMIYSQASRRSLPRRRDK